MIHNFGYENAPVSQGTCSDQVRYLMNELGDEFSDQVSPIAGVKKENGKIGTHAAILVNSEGEDPYVIDPYNNSVYSLDDFLSDYSIVLQYFDDFKLDSSGSVAIQTVLSPSDIIEATQVATEITQ